MFSFVTELVSFFYEAYNLCIISLIYIYFSKYILNIECVLSIGQIVAMAVKTTKKTLFILLLLNIFPSFRILLTQDSCLKKELLRTAIY